MLDFQDRPLMVQSDLLLLLDVSKPRAEQAREKLLLFADSLRQAGSIHTYQATALTLWQASAAGCQPEDIIGWLLEYGKYELPLQAEAMIRRLMGRYGKLSLLMEADQLILQGEAMLMKQLYEQQTSSIASFVQHRSLPDKWVLTQGCRGAFKQEMTRIGYPVIDLAGYHQGEELPVRLRELTARNQAFSLRDYQMEAVEAFYREGTVQGGSGIVVLPCGTGKTIVGVAALARLGRATLILTSSRTSVKQWRDELLDKTSLTPSQIGEYSGSVKEVRPVTIATYHMLTHRKANATSFMHMKLFTERDWGLVIYDEVHLLPAPVFRMTADIQATRRLGLTATLVREDGCAEDVYALIGPKQYEMKWKKAESDSYIATVACTEIRVPLDSEKKEQYRSASARSQFRLAAENPEKLSVVKQLLRKHEGAPTLIIGQYLDQLHDLSDKLGAPLLTGELKEGDRQQLYNRFKDGTIKVLIVSKVANLAVDLPDAAVAIQLSGSFGSRQEEAQRIGRLLRPKQGYNRAWFYTIVTDDTKETEFALRRQLFMLEQGYPYERINLPDNTAADEEVPDIECAAIK